MEIRHLHLLRELGERGSLAAVAEAAHVSPSAVSQQLRALQRQAAVPLTERRGRRLALTPAGRALAGAAVDIAEALGRAERAVGGHLADRTAPVRVSAFHSAGQAFFGPLLAWSSGSGGPPVHCRDEDIAQASFPALVADHDLVLAHRLRHGPRWPTDRGLVVTRLLSEPMDVALAADHPLAAAPEVAPVDAAAHPWVAVHQGFPLTGVLDGIGAAAGRPLDVVHRVNDFGLASAVAAAGRCLALVPRHLGRPGLHPGVVTRPLHGIAVTRDVDVLARPENLARVAVAETLDQLRALTAALVAATSPPQR
ncbi:DNA-binding transcriptional regulator, LysR family [Klenkia soli]|uniref:DNA-binding transcriptional regulator, LysR family n=1 Tax=Klenkia soli TaxID=1052260 RepID=A0A1H0E772_9ACTN|nr:LysR family transcriptional regulator [Klenkia soli]SDN78141.1 DNA-binding transcriptional regulator, LysR family [Klenkia soli]